MLQLAGADRVLTMDLHAGQIQGFFTIPVDHMTALPLFARHFRDLGLHRRRRRLRLARRRPRQAGRSLRRDDRGRLRDHAQDAPRARRRRGDRDRRPRPRQDRDPRRRRDHDRRHDARERRRRSRSTARARSGSSRRTALFCGDALEQLRRRRTSRASSSPTRCRSTRSTKPDKLTVLPVVGAPRRDDHERLRRRLGVGDLRRREPALLASVRSTMRVCGRSANGLQTAARSGEQAGHR